MSENRLLFLDGMRGWGALAVYLFHLGSFLFFKGKFQFFDIYFYNTPLQILSDGELAIFLFFILSGFSLSYKFFNTAGDNLYLKEAAQYRYFRLLIPVFFAILIPYFITKFHLMFNTKGYVGAYSSHFHFWDMLKYTFIELPFKFGSNHGLYGPIFWTIYLEFTASLLIFSFLALFGTWNLRFLLYPLIIISLCSLEGQWNFYFLFFSGVVICDLFCLQKNYGYLSEIRIPYSYKKALSVITLFAITYIYYYCVVGQQPIIFDNPRYAFGILLFILTLNTPLFSKFFSSKVSKFLGRISFSLYLTHFPILCSLLFFIFNFLTNHGYSLVVTSLIAGFLSSIVVILVAYIFSLYVEERILIAIKLALKKISKITIHHQPILTSYNAQEQAME